MLAQLGKQAAKLTLHGSRIGLCEEDYNGNAAVLLDGYNVAGLSGIRYQSAQTGMTALAGGGQTATSTYILNSAVNVLATVATASDSVMLPPTSGRIPTGGAISVTVINPTSIALAVFPSSGDAINAVATNGSHAIASSGVTTYHCASSGKWYSK